MTAADDAIERMRAAALASGHEDDPGAPGTVDPDVVRTALATLGHDDQQLLWDLHVVERRVDVVAREMGLHTRSVLRRLRAAEQRLTAALSAAHARGTTAQVCMETRGALHEYVRHALPAARRQSFEEHLFGCSGCMRAFIDVREASWALRDVAPVLLAGTAGSGIAVPVVVGAVGQPAASAGLLAWPAAVGGALVGAWEWLVRGLRQVFARPVAVAGGVGAAAVVTAAIALGGGVDGTTADAPESPPAAAPSPSPDDGGAPDEAPTDGPSATPSPTSDPTPTPTPSPTPSPPADPTPEPPVADPEESVPTASPTGPPSSPAPEDPGAPDPVPEPTVEPTPETPDPTPTPTATRDPEPSPTPEPSDPEPREVTIGLDVPRHGLYRVVVSGDAEIVSVTAESGNVQVEHPHRYWWVWTRGGSAGTVSVELLVPEGSEPGAELSFLGLD